MRSPTFQQDDPRADSGRRQTETDKTLPGRKSSKTFYTAGIFFMGFVGALHVARDFFIPVALAILLALTLTPAVRALRRCHIPTAAGAAIVLLAVLGLFAL